MTRKPFPLLIALLCSLCLCTGASADIIRVEIAPRDTAAPVIVTAASPAVTDADLQQQIDAVRAKYTAVGLSAAYVRDGAVAETYASGWATLKKQPMTADTKVRIASVSKVMVGLAAHLLAEQGKIDLDAPIDSAIGFRLRTRSSADTITPRHILTHTSSLMRQPSASGKYESVHALLSDPGNYYAAVSGSLKNWDYNNFAFYVLGLALEHAGGRTLDQVLNQGLCDAIGADASFWAGDLDSPELVATVYAEDHSVGLSWEEQVTVHSKGPAVNGSVFAGNYHISAQDLGKIAAVLANDGQYNGVQVLSAQVVEAMEHCMPAPVPDNSFYQAQPLRYRENMYGRQGLYYHTGSAYGELCFFSYDPVRRDGVVVLTTGAQRMSKDGVYGACAEVAELLYNAH
ncbi:MAG: beta-lactamase family protein [Clostridia bacterium]|nr:beta-lactamase family protein [Clostridia bacterium]